MTELLDESIRGQVRDAFVALQEPVHILFFGSDKNCLTCDETRQLVEEVIELSDRLSLEIYDLEADAAVASQYHVDKAPGLVINAKNGDEIIDYGIRISGIPSGHEFSTLIQDILSVSKRDSGLSESTRSLLQKVDKPVHLQVFVTPT